MKTTTYQDITVAELEAKLLALKPGANFIALTIETVPSRMRKTDNPFVGNVFKRSTMSVQIQADYGKAVNRQRIREGQTDDFQVQAPLWGERVGKSCVVRHKGKTYMEFRALKCLRSVFVDGAGNQYSDSDAESVRGFITPRKPSPKQNLKDEITWRKPELKNVRAIHINRKKYRIVPG